MKKNLLLISLFLTLMILVSCQSNPSQAYIDQTKAQAVEDDKRDLKWPPDEDQLTEKEDTEEKQEIQANTLPEKAHNYQLAIKNIARDDFIKALGLDSSNGETSPENPNIEIFDARFEIYSYENNPNFFADLDKYEIHSSMSEKISMQEGHENYKKDLNSINIQDAVDDSLDTLASMGLESYVLKDFYGFNKEEIESILKLRKDRDESTPWKDGNTYESNLNPEIAEDAYYLEFIQDLGDGTLYNKSFGWTNPDLFHIQSSIIISYTKDGIIYIELGPYFEVKEENQVELFSQDKVLENIQAEFDSRIDGENYTIKSIDLTYITSPVADDIEIEPVYSGEATLMAKPFYKVLISEKYLDGDVHKLWIDDILINAQTGENFNHGEEF